MEAKFKINLRYYTDTAFHRVNTTIGILYETAQDFYEFLKSDYCSRVFSYDYLRSCGDKIIKFNFYPKHLFKDEKHASFDVYIDREKIGHIVFELTNKNDFKYFSKEV